MHTLAPELHKVNGPTSSCCCRLGLGVGQRTPQAPGPGVSWVVPSHPIQARDQKEAIVISASTAGAPMAGHRPHPNSGPGPETLTSPSPLPLAAAESPGTEG